ncbi:arylsulfatase I-like [Anableps anableps]
MATTALTGFSVMSLLSLGYLSCDMMSPNQVENEPGQTSNDRSPVQQPPHIIFIMTDDQGFSDIGYRSSDIRTPVLDKLAADGVKLENYYVQPICTPSRSQLITGRYQIHTGLQHSIIHSRQPNCLPFDQITLPQRLQQLGYSTHMVGKWHLGFYKKECLPTRRGFDTYLGSLTGSTNYYTYKSCDGPRVCGFDLHEGESVAWRHRDKYSTHLYTKRVRKILATHDPLSKPLFIFLSFQAVHIPLQYPEEYIYPYRKLKNAARKKYAAMVSTVDEAVHNITHDLRRYGYYKNSVLIFSTDNGGQPFSGGSNWPLRGRKGTYWEGGVRGLGFVHSPLLKKKRRVSKALVHITDWYPTLVGLAGGNESLTEGVDGYNIWEAISEGKESPRFEILHNIDPLYKHARTGSLEKGFGIWNTAIQASIRTGDWKLLTGNPGYGDWIPPPILPSFSRNYWKLEQHIKPDKSVWLFNLSGDPYERFDLSEQRPDVVKELLARLVYYNQTAVPVRYPSEDPQADPQLNGGAWVPWMRDEEENWDTSYKKENMEWKRKLKMFKSRSFFRRFNTVTMSNKI